MQILDLGCGWGELMLRAIAQTADSSGVGVDTNLDELERGRRLAERAGLASRVSFKEADATHFDGSFDRVISIGASHAWGGSKAALAGLQQHLDHGGRGLYGDAFWGRPPTDDLVKMLGDLEPSLSQLVNDSVAAGLRPIHVDVASEPEWDEFEWNSCRGLEEYALAHPSDELAPLAREMADIRRDEYLRGYRGVLGFGYLILAKP